MSNNRKQDHEYCKEMTCCVTESVPGVQCGSVGSAGAPLQPVLGRSGPLLHVVPPRSCLSQLSNEGKGPSIYLQKNQYEDKKEKRFSCVLCEPHVVVEAADLGPV